jgi:hypothetical protein
MAREIRRYSARRRLGPPAPGFLAVCWGPVYSTRPRNCVESG